MNAKVRDSERPSQNAKRLSGSVLQGVGFEPGTFRSAGEARGSESPSQSAKRISGSH